MNESLAKYIETAKHKGHSPDQIKTDLIQAGWDSAEVSAALGLQDDDLLPPPPPPGHHGTGHAKSINKDHDPNANLVKVVPFRSTAGLEYIILFISMWVAAMSLAAVLHAVVDGLFRSEFSFYEGINTFSSAAFIVSFPIFAFLFLRLKNQEIREPEIRRDVNRKNAVQLTLIVTFLIGLGKTIFYIYQLLNVGNSGVTGAGTYLSETLHTVITVGISGFIFVYYWIDDHKKVS